MAQLRVGSSSPNPMSFRFHHAKALRAMRHAVRAQPPPAAVAPSAETLECLYLHVR